MALGAFGRPLEGVEVSPLQDQLSFAVIEDWHGRDDPRGDAQVLATSTIDDREVASRWFHEDAEVFVLPHRNPISPEALNSILDAVDRIPRVPEFPAYLDDFILGKEDDLRGELAKLELRRAKILDELDSLRRPKAILHLSGLMRTLESEPATSRETAKTSC